MTNRRSISIFLGNTNFHCSVLSLEWQNILKLRKSRARVQSYESEFTLKHGRKPDRHDLEKAPDHVRTCIKNCKKIQVYATYTQFKIQRSNGWSIFCRLTSSKKKMLPLNRLPSTILETSKIKFMVTSLKIYLKGTIWPINIRLQRKLLFNRFIRRRWGQLKL